MFHLRGIVCSTYVGRCFIYVEPSVPPIGTVRSIYWNCVFQSMELSWNTTSLVRITVDIAVEVPFRDVTIGTEDVEDIILLLGREREYAVHVAVVG